VLKKSSAGGDFLVSPSGCGSVAAGWAFASDVFGSAGVAAAVWVSFVGVAEV
jgi:hypothetical protein